MRKLLENKTLRGLIDLYEYEVTEVREDKDEVLLYDKQLDEYTTLNREELVNYFAYDCYERYYIDGNEFHKKQADELRSLLNDN